MTYPCMTCIDMAITFGRYDIDIEIYLQDMKKLTNYGMGGMCGKNKTVLKIQQITRVNCFITFVWQTFLGSIKTANSFCYTLNANNICPLV